jgi:hypothetical protein
MTARGLGLNLFAPADRRCAPTFSPVRRHSYDFAPVDAETRATLKALVVLGLLLVGVVWLLDHAAAMTLAYIRALIWPLVALTAAFLFRGSIRGLLANVRLSSLTLAGNKAEFRERQRQPTSDEDAYLTQLLSMPDPDLLDEQLELVDDEASEEPFTPRERSFFSAARYLFILNQIFEIQLDFLRYLRAADEGLSIAAVDDWWTEAKRERNITPELTNEGLLQFITTNNFAHVTTDGLWELTPNGAEFLEFVDTTWYADKAW